MKKFSFVFVLAFLFCGFVFGQEKRPLKILEQPLPPVPNEIRSTNVQGTVVIRVEFLASGQIGKVAALKEVPYGLTADVLAVARKIKFEPRIIKGNPVTSYEEFGYNFTWDGGWKVNARKRKSNKPKVPRRVEKARSVIKKAIARLGGNTYLNVNTSVSKGKFSLLKDGQIVSFQSFIDVIVYPDRERTDFSERGSKTVQVNTGETGWIYQEHIESFRDQNDTQVGNFKRSLRTHYDFLLRGKWAEEAVLSYVGRRQESLGKSNDVVKLEFDDGFEVEFEFSDEGMPMKTVYTRMNADNRSVTEEKRYAQFINTGGILTPFILDHYTDKKHSFRVNYEAMEYNRQIPPAIFNKPDNPKKLRKKLKL